MRWPSVLLLALVAWGCKPAERGSGNPAAASGPLVEARELLQQGQLDAALAKILEAPGGDAEALCIQGLVWAKKAELAPLPTPQPGETVERPPEFKPEELRAADLFERARSLRPTLAEAHLGLANILAPHAVRRFELAASVRRTAGPKARVTSAQAPGPQDGTDFSVARVVSLYRDAVNAEPQGLRGIDDLLRFSLRIKDLDAASWAYTEGIKRERENPDRLIQFGDFLARERADRHGAIDQYRQALIWRPDDTATKSKLAMLYLDLGREHLAAQQWGAAATMLTEAQKYVVDKRSAQGMQVQAGLDELASIRKAD